jgi:endo-1,4-beta-xylanase
LTGKSVILLLSIVFLFGLSANAQNRLSTSGEEEDYHPAVTALFESEDPFVQEVVIPSIEKTRKSDVVLQFVSTDGQPLAGCKVSVELKRHEFLFGHCDLAKERDARKRALLNDLFHFTCPGYATKWKAIAPELGVYDFSKVDAMLDYCKANDIDFEWHFLSGYHPDWLESIDSDVEKARLQQENGRTVLKRYHDKVRFIQVFNEDWLTHIARAKVYSDQTAYFSSLRAEFPEVELGVCDCWSFNEESRLPDVDTLTTRYPGIDFVSMHAHLPRRLWASPEEMYQTYNPYLDSDIKIHVTEFGIIKGEMQGSYRVGEWDEENLAEYFVQAAATAFSHPAVRVFNFWSNYDKFTGNRLFTDVGEPNAKYHALKSLLKDKLTTRVAGKTDKNGQCAFRGFHGRYDVVLEFQSGGRAHACLEVRRDASDFKLILDEQAGTYKCTSLNWEGP